MGQWFDGGNDARLYAGFANNGSYSLRLRDNNGMESSIYFTKDVRAYTKFDVSFSLMAKYCSGTDMLILETASSLTGIWKLEKSWVFNTATGFTNNTRVLLSNVNASLPSVKNPFYLRLRSNTSTNTHALYLDSVVLKFY